VILIRSPRSGIADSKGGFAQSGLLCPFARASPLPPTASFSSSLAPSSWESRPREEIGARSSVYRYHVCLVMPRFHVQIRQEQLSSGYHAAKEQPFVAVLISRIFVCVEI